MFLRYAIVDKHLNPPLLQVAQPKTMTERNSAERDLLIQLEIGTLVINKYINEVRSPIYTSPNAIQFDEVFVNWGDSNFVFDLLATNRSDFVAIINSQTKNDANNEISKKIALEIFEHTLSDERSSFPDLPVELIDKFKLASSKLEKSSVDIKEKLELQSDLPLNELITQLSNIFKYSKSTLYQEFFNTYYEREDLHKKLIAYCEAATTLQNYLESIKKTQLLIGLRSFMVVAKYKNFYFRFWRMTGGQSIKVVEECVGDNSQPIDCILRKGPLYFNLLNPLQTSSDNEPYQLRLEKTFNHLKITNKYKHNLLHRAVRSIAADILTPVLLNNLQLNTEIDALDESGKTALHRAIKYFAEFRNNIILELNNDQVKYENIIKTTLENLIKAGAKLHYKDNEGKDALDRARFFQSQYQFQDSKFKLDAWLVQQLNQYNPSVATPSLPPTTNAAPKNIVAIDTPTASKRKPAVITATKNPTPTKKTKYAIPKDSPIVTPSHQNSIQPSIPISIRAKNSSTPLPSLNQPSPLSQTPSIFDLDDEELLAAFDQSNNFSHNS